MARYAVGDRMVDRIDHLDGSDPPFLLIKACGVKLDASQAHSLQLHLG